MLEGRRIVVVGGSRGIGRAIAVAAARAGAAVAITYRTRQDAAEEVIAEIAEHTGRRAHALRLDVRDAAAVERAVEELDVLLGGIDGWVHGAAVRYPALLVASEVERLREEIDVDLVGAILAARAVLPRMMRARLGVLMFLGSVAAHRPVRGQAVYAAAKAGLEGLTRALAVEYAKKGIRVVCLNPGAVDTDMLASTRALGEDELVERIPQRRVAEPADVAAYAVFLLGDEARAITGSVHTVDGGYSVG